MDASENLKLLQFLLTGTLVMFLLAGGVIVFFLVYQKRLHRQQLELTNLEAGHKADLLHSNIESIEVERKRIAADLHDEVGSMLSTLKLKIRQLSPGSNESTRKIVHDSAEMIDQSIQSVRRLTHDITPPGLEMFGLVDTLEALCEKISIADIFYATLHTPNPIPKMDPKIELGLYRIVQELVQNTQKHANASSVQIELSILENILTLVYSDNGKGMDPEKLNEARGLGLKNIESRTSYLGGHLAWETYPGQGLKTIITLRL
jgi:two-component system NarL family sensor kinase